MALNAMKKHSQNTPPQVGESLLTKETVAKKILSISPRHLENLMRAKAISFVRIGRSVRFEPSAVEAFKSSHRVNAA